MAKALKITTNIKHSYILLSKRHLEREDRRIFGSGFLGKQGKKHIRKYGSDTTPRTRVPNTRHVPYSIPLAVI